MLSIRLHPLQRVTLPSSNILFRSSLKFKSQPRCRSVLAATKPNHLAPLHITYTTDHREIDVVELADLMSRCATHSPGHATNAAESYASRSTTTTTTTTELQEIEGELEKKELTRRFQRRLRRALNNSLVCIAAYVPESLLPDHLHRSARSLPPDLKNTTFSFFPPNLWRLAPGIFLVPGPKVLVGFARAVSDAALVATVHDIAVLPEIREKGLGKILVEKLTDQVS